MFLGESGNSRSLQVTNHDRNQGQRIFQTGYMNLPCTCGSAFTENGGPWKLHITPTQDKYFFIFALYSHI
jgi:hypothetical protein